MPKITYVFDKKFKPETLALIRWADKTATDYKRRGYNLSLRQLYYQGVSQNMFANTEKMYNKLGRVVSDGRLAGMIDWDHLEDRGRESYGTDWLGHLPDSQAEIIRKSRFRYSLDLWRGQERRIEVWVEKQALEEVAQKAAGAFRVGYFACKGYVSQSEMWEAGMRQYEAYNSGQTPLILHLGDHDPSGIDMTRDIEERLSLFADQPVEVKRLALNMDQIQEFNPPPNPAKMTDSRFGEYQKQYGNESWELDSIRPESLVALIKKEISQYVDRELFDERLDKENAGRAVFEEVADRWDEVVTALDLSVDGHDDTEE